MLCTNGQRNRILSNYIYITWKSIQWKYMENYRFRFVSPGTFINCHLAYIEMCWNILSHIDSVRVNWVDAQMFACVQMNIYNFWRSFNSLHATIVVTQYFLLQTQSELVFQKIPLQFGGIMIFHKEFSSEKMQFLMRIGIILGELSH